MQMIMSSKMLRSTGKLSPLSIIILGVFTATTIAEVSNEVCETPGCVHAASQILDRMDPTVEPCDDFYRFACGRYTRETIIPDDKSSVNLMSKMHDDLQAKIKTSIENDIKVDDPRAFKLLQDFYKTCMDTAQIEENSEGEFCELLKQLGGWPVLEGESWDESNFDWKNSVYKFRNTGYSIDIYIAFGIHVDLMNDTRRLIYLNQASTSLPREYLSKGLDEKIVRAYFKFMTDVAEIFGADREKAKAELAESLDFEIELAKISVPREEARNKTKLYNPMTVSKLESKYPYVPWTAYVNELLKPHAEVRADETVVVQATSFLDAFSELMTRTPKRVLANYAMWRVAASSAGLLSERVQRAETEFAASVTGVKVQKPRWKECLSFASGSLEIATGALYARRHFDESAKAKAVELIENVRKSFQRIIAQVDWMDDETKKAALEKLAAMVPHVAYPEEFLDDKQLDEYYRDVEVDPASFLKSQLHVNLFDMAYEFKQLRQPVNKSHWIRHGNAAMVNAYYSDSENSMSFPAGILQGGFFTNDRPNYLNYGAIGFVMGHEMTHGFDDEGRQFDKQGNLVDWWEPETKKKYLERAQCIVDQYSNYTVKEIDLHINGNNTQGENISDNGGIKEAYFAYNDWERSNGQEPRLPGLPYTSQQMFWISAANIWCSKYKPEVLRDRVVIDSHSPPEFRVIGSMSNVADFSKDFSCPLGSTMNSAKKCTVW